MNWSTFWTYTLQAVIVLVILFVVSAVVVGVVQQIRKSKP